VNISFMVRKKKYTNSSVSNYCKIFSISPVKERHHGLILSFMHAHNITK
jgi:hypothetical protein